MMNDSAAAGVEKVLSKYGGASRDALIPILQEVQGELGYLSRSAVVSIGRHLDLPVSKIYGVATFYNQFRFTAPGRFHIQVCRGTACHVKGSEGLLRCIERELEIKTDQTTRDGIFSLEVVACIGACGLAPVIAVNGEFHAKVDNDDVTKILRQYRKQARSDEAKNE